MATAATSHARKTRSRADAAELLERDLESRLIDGAIGRTREGAGGTIAIAGPAGIGKSALLRVARDSAEDAGMWAFAATGRELEQGFAFGVSRQLLEPALRALEPHQRERMLSGAAAPAAALLNDEPAAGAAPDAAFAFTHALYWLTANLAERCPILLAVDDLQWVDGPSQQLLAYLVPRLEELPVLLACALRSGEAELAELEALLAREAPARTLRPAPLSAPAVGVLVRRAVGAGASDAFCEACHRATGGNPFLARELARVASAEGIAGGDADVGGLRSLTPDTVMSSALPRIRRLGDRETAVARAVAVLERAELRHAAALAEIDDLDLVEAVDELVKAGIIAGDRPVRFAHPIIRDAVYRDLGDAARERAHRRAAMVLSQTGADARAVASHLERTEPRGEEWAADALARAGLEALSEGSPEVAAPALRRALAEGVDRGRAAVLYQLGQAEAALGDPNAAARLMQARDEATDPDDRARALVTLAETRFLAGEFAPSVDEVGRALDELEGTEDAERPSNVQLYLGYVVIARAYAPSARDAHARIRGRAAGDSSEEPLAERARLAALAYDGFLCGRPADVVREQAALGIGDAALLDAGGPAAWTFYLAAWALAGADGFDACEAALRAAEERATASGSLLGSAMVTHHRLWAHWRRGRIRHALADSEIALELAGRGWDLLRPAAGWARAECLIEAGDIEAAAEVIGEIEQLAPGVVGTGVEGWPLMGRSRLELERGAPERALAAAIDAGSVLSALHTSNPAVADWRSRAGIAAAALGDGTRGRELWEEELRLARAFGAPRAIGIALRAGGVIEGGERGLALLREAVATLEPSPARLERARALTDLGAALRRARRPREAREPLREALQVAGECGATSLGRRAHEELLAAGARPRRTALTGVDSLTAREHRVAELAAAGLGNREIAQRLFITRKTVEAHLRNIFRKLEIASRDEVAELLGGAGRSPDE
jgi:DNA-binding CsgD family transcriptional regulator